MVCCHILSGKEAGAKVSTVRFPWRVGRAAGEDLRLEEPGVWDHHCEVVLDFSDGFILRAHPDARTLINGQNGDHARLRNGDVIEMGAVKLQFWLAETVQPSLRWIEWQFWLLIGALSLGQIAIIYWLAR